MAPSIKINQPILPIFYITDKDRKYLNILLNLVNYLLNFKAKQSRVDILYYLSDGQPGLNCLNHHQNHEMETLEKKFQH